jgi:hypothetical protein
MELQKDDDRGRQQAGLMMMEFLHHYSVAQVDRV